MMDTEQIYGFIKIGIPWLFVNAIGCPIAFIVGFGIILLDDFDPTPPEFPVYESYPLLITIAFAGLSMGLIIGIAQWPILRKWFVDGLKWILMTGIGWSLGLVLGLSLYDWLKYVINIEPTIFEVIANGLSIGFFSGIAQWMLLRHYIPKSGWWIFTTSLGWILGLAYIQTMGEGTLIAFIVMGIIAGIFSGFLLVQSFIPVSRKRVSQIR